MDAEHVLKITDIRTFEVLGPELKPVKMHLVEYVLDDTHAGVLKLPAAEYSREKVLELALKRLEERHPDVGSEIRG